MKELLKAERALSLIDQTSFDGWLMAKARVSVEHKDFQSQAPPVETAILRRTRKAAVLLVSQPALRLTVTLLNTSLSIPDPVSENAGKEIVPSEELDRFSFSKAALSQYLEETRDSNMIHRSGRLVVPGLCLLNRALCSLQMGYQEGWRLEIRFLHPVYVEDTVVLSRQSQEQYIAFVRNLPVFTICY